MNRNKKIAVFCSSAPDLPADIQKTALLLGRTIGESGGTLVYGGVNAGLMHCVAQGAAEAGATIIGVIPEMFLHRADALCTSVIRTPDLSTRKGRMISDADIFVVLPGGLGTIDEWVSTASHIMANRLSDPGYNPPIIVYNRDGMYDSMVAQFHTTDAGIFSRGRKAEAGTIVATADGLIDALRDAISL